jgi:hypothetical protein
MPAVLVSGVPEAYSRNPEHLEVGEDLMPGTVFVSGLVKDGMGGLKESQTAFRKHHKDVANALLNISGIDTPTGEAVDKDEERMPYVKQAFPMMIYHPEKGEMTVYEASELKEAQRSGWRQEPYIKVRITMNDPGAEKAALEAKLKEQNGVIVQQNDLLQKLLDRVAALEKKD